MADYYPLISRALDGLSDKSPEMRRAVYDRARNALTAQLQSLNPPLPQNEISRERRALDDAVDRIEAEYVLRDAIAAAPLPLRETARATPAPSPEAARATPAPAPAPAREPARATPAPSRSESPPPPSRTEPTPAPSRTEPPPSRTEPSPRRPPAETTAPVLVEPAPPPVDADDLQASPQPRERPRVGTVSHIRREPVRARAIVLGAVLLVVVGLIAAAAWFLRVQPSELEAGPAAVDAPKVAEGDNKITDRVGGERPTAAPPASTATAPGGAPPASARPDLAVAQRAILYEENQADPQNPKATPGRVLWRLDALNPGQGQNLETVVRANVDLPGAGVSLAVSLRRNTDGTLPASHIIELTFATSDDAQRMVRDVGLLQFKSEEAVRGTPIAGLPVPVKDNVFLIGLSNLPGDMERNRELMLRRNWIDLPVRFASGQRAILSFEKGVSGDQVINDAFRMWQ